VHAEMVYNRDRPEDFASSEPSRAKSSGRNGRMLQRTGHPSIGSPTMPASGYSPKRVTLARPRTCRQSVMFTCDERSSTRQLRHRWTMARSTLRALWWAEADRRRWRISRPRGRAADGTPSFAPRCLVPGPARRRNNAGRHRRPRESVKSGSANGIHAEKDHDNDRLSAHPSRSSYY
jgi:hypothetical protein